MTTSSKPRRGLARDPWRRDMESRACRRCGAGTGEQCITATGTWTDSPHAERWNDAKRARGEQFYPQQEGTPSRKRRA